MALVSARRLRTFIAGLGTLLVAAGASHAGEPGADQVSPFAGSFQQRIPIAVPGYHGLEPRLSLSYTSEGRNGHFGVGWTLSGFSTIERASAGSGSPLFEASDIYLLDGRKLVACGGGVVSPSCAHGGTHASEDESHLRIAKDGGTNTWTVTGRDGTRTTFSPIVTLSQGTFRWGQTQVTDTTGNTVSYTWACPDGECYPATVAYGPWSVTFYRESRPDVRSFAGLDSLRESLYRIRSVAVRHNSAVIRALKLAYTVSALTGRSLLVSAQEFGKDAVIDGQGALTGGTALPATTFGYTSDPLGEGFQGPSSPPIPPVTDEPASWTNKVGQVVITGTGNSLQKTGAGGSYDAGYTSTRALLGGDGHVRWHGTGAAAVGLSNGDGPNGTLGDIDFAIEVHVGSGTARAVE